MFVVVNSTDFTYICCECSVAVKLLSLPFVIFRHNTPATRSLPRLHSREQTHSGRYDFIVLGTAVRVEKKIKKPVFHIGIMEVSSHVEFALSKLQSTSILAKRS